jgi:broad specificity phosphatase PhoE
MSKIYLIRHGETVWNVEGKFQGFGNSNLTEKGMQQAMAVGRFLQDKSIEQIYCSPLQRAKDTLTIIRSQNPDLIAIETIYDDKLKECNYGKIEGMDENIIRTQLLLQGIDRRDPETKFSFRFEGGESYQDQMVRAMHFIMDNEILNSKENTAIICHMGTVKFLNILLQGKVSIPDIHEAVMWRPSNSVVVVIDSVTGEAEVADLAEK